MSIYPYSNYEILFPDLKRRKFKSGWDDGKDVILKYVDGDKDKTILIPDVPRYFLIKTEDFYKADKAKWNWWKGDGLFKSGKIADKYAYIFHDHVWRTDFYDWLRELHEMGIEPLEADLTRTARMMIDLDLKVAPPEDLKIAYYDIETDDRRNQIMVGEDRVLSVGIKDATGYEHFILLPEDSDEAETFFLTEVMQILCSYDVLIGYNSYGFDELVLEGRMKKFGIPTKDWRNVCRLDMFNQAERQGVFREFKVPSRKLDTVAKAVIGRGKIPHTEKIYDLWKNNKNLLNAYNMEDVRILFDMEEKLKTSNLVLTMMSYAGVLYSQQYSPLRVIETFLMRNAHKKRVAGELDFRFPTGYYLPEHNLHKEGRGSAFARNSLSADRRKSRGELLEEMGIEYEKIEGGYVMESTPIFTDNVAGFDFSSLYPSVMMAFNVCYSTLVEQNEHCPKNFLPNGTAFRTDFVGLMPSAVEFLISERKRIRAEMKKEKDPVKHSGLDLLQKTVKILTNSFYGVTGLWGSRLFSSEIGNAITCFGRFALPFAEEYFLARDRKTVVQDTDSTYIVLKDGDDPQKMISEFITCLRDTIKEKYNVYRPEILNMAYEKHYKKILVVKKKMYAGLMDMKDGLIIDPPEITVTGLRLIKSDASAWARNSAQIVLDDLLRKNYGADHFIRFLECEKKKLQSGKIPLEDLIVSSRLGKEIKDYTGENKLVYVRIAERLIERGTLVPSHSVINYVIIDGTSPLQGLGDEEIEDGATIDAVYYFNTGLMGVVSPILEIAFPEVVWDDLKFPRKLKKTNYFELKVSVKRTGKQIEEIVDAEE